MNMKCLNAVLRLRLDGFLHLASLRQERKCANVLVFTGQCLDMNLGGRFESIRPEMQLCIDNEAI